MRKRTLYPIILISLILSSILLAPIIYTQVVPLTYEQTLNGVTKAKNDKKTQKILLRLINERKVDFVLTKEQEEELKIAGATREIIEAIRKNPPTGNSTDSQPFTIVEIYDKLKENKTLEAQKTLIEQIKKRKVSDLLDDGTQKFFVEDGATIELIDAIKQNPYGPKPTPSPIQTSGDGGWTNSIGMEFVQVPKGFFMMGSTLVEDEQPMRKVTFAKEFSIGKFEVTQGEWETLMGKTEDWLTNKKNLLNANQPDPLKKIDFNKETIGDNYPMFMVSWEDAQAFITKLNALNDGYVYSLPSEAEWEYSCRAGTDTYFAFGDSITTADASFYNPGFINPPKQETPNKQINKIKPVGTYQPNTWGIYDMHGNLTEWCQDIYSGYKGYLGLPVDGSANTTKGDSSVRITRGGNWISPQFMFLRSARRDYKAPSFANTGTGFRVVAKKK